MHKIKEFSSAELRKLHDLNVNKSGYSFRVLEALQEYANLIEEVQQTRENMRARIEKHLPIKKDSDLYTNQELRMAKSVIVDFLNGKIRLQPESFYDEQVNVRKLIFDVFHYVWVHRTWSLEDVNIGLGEKFGARLGMLSMKLSDVRNFLLRFDDGVEDLEMAGLQNESGYKKLSDLYRDITTGTQDAKVVETEEHVDGN